jgi:hypothetical protein
MDPNSDAYLSRIITPFQHALLGFQLLVGTKISPKKDKTPMSFAAIPSLVS